MVQGKLNLCVHIYMWRILRGSLTSLVQDLNKLSYIILLEYTLMYVVYSDQEMLERLRLDLDLIKFIVKSITHKLLYWLRDPYDNILIVPFLDQINTITCTIECYRIWCRTWAKDLLIIMKKCISLKPRFLWMRKLWDKSTHCLIRHWTLVL